MRNILLFISLIGCLSIWAQEEVQTHSFSLAEAQDYAIQNNQQIQNAQLDIQIAKKKVWETTAIGLPQASASVGHNYNIDLPVTLIPANTFNPNAPAGEYLEMKFGTDHNTSANIQVTQLIFSGEYIVGLRAAKIYKQLSENQYNKSEKELKEQIANTYELILIAQERKAILTKNIENTKTIYNDTKAMFDVGLAQETDAAQLKINLSNLENALKSADRQTESIKNLLKFQMNIPIADNLILTDKLEGLLLQTNIAELQESSFQMDQHFDFKLMQTQENLQKLSVDREKTTFLPNLSAFYNHQESMMSNKFEVFNGGTWYGSNVVGLSLNIPIFSSGMRLSKVSQAKIELDKVRNSKQQLEESLNMQVIQARLNLETAQESYLLQKDNKDLSEKIYKDYEERYKQGMASSMELTQSQIQYLNTEQSYFQSIFDLLDSKNKLDKALGL